MRSLTTKAYAKINLYLDVCDLRPDGYHNIESIMQQVSLCDRVTVEQLDEGHGIKITCTDPAVPTDERNIVHKCAVRFFEHFGIKDYSIAIHIDKEIPSCGGLAGGSTDGAAVLKLLNELYCTNADESILCEIGVKVGADIPFYIVGGTCICRGIGEILTPVEVAAAKYQVLISFPGEGISTPAAYKMLDSIDRHTDHAGIDDVLSALRGGDIPTEMYNAFELAVLPGHENARLVKKVMLDFGAVSSMMSGSGSTIFGLFDDTANIQNATVALGKLGFESHTCSPIN